MKESASFNIPISEIARRFSAPQKKSVVKSLIRYEYEKEKPVQFTFPDKRKSACLPHKIKKTLQFYKILE